MPPKIHVLAPEVSNQIAAGEVVERPSSVVKELVENSMDAGATEITVEVEASGRRLVMVTDNGEGMGREDLVLCVQRHATSKLSSAGELTGIQSFGFRGEALPSIASVARVAIQSRQAGGSEGWRLEVEGGQVGSPELDGWPRGTRVAVRDLFFNTPARAKFLKTPATETQRMQQALLHLAMGRPDIGLRFRLDGREHLRFDACAGLEERCRQVLGKSFLDTAVAVEKEAGGLKVLGWVSPPSQHRGNRNAQHFFVNGRWVEHRLLGYHLAQGYAGSMPPGRFPTALLFLSLPGESLDVNVHPAKREVRFSQENAVMDLVRRSVRGALEQRGFHAAVHFHSASSSLVPAPGPTAAVSASLVSESAGAYAPAPHQRESGWAAPPAQPEVDPAFPAPLAQLHQSYILCQHEDGLLLVDQHAAHERVNYEKILAQVRAGALESQNLLLPLKLSLGQAQAAALRAVLDSLQAFGLEINDMGGGDFYLNAVPVLLKGAQVGGLLEDILEADGSELRSDRQAPFVERVAANLACKASVKAGQPLTLEEMRALVRDLFRCRMPWDPHGRPATAKISLRELEKHFHR